MNIFFNSGFGWTFFPTVLAFVLFIFLILREVLTWYWKINKIIVLLEQIEENTRPHQDAGKEVQ